MKQTRLLPHKWQINGAFMFVIFFLIALFSDVSHVARITHLSGDVLLDISRDLQFLLELLLIPLSGILMALSMERREDEMISAMRRRSLLTAIIVWIIINILSVLESLLLSLLIQYKPTLSGAFDMQPFVRLSNIGFFPLVYVICLKLSLWIQDRKLSKSDSEGAVPVTATKSYLLPHRWQMVGFAVFAVMFVIPLCFSFSTVSGSSPADVLEHSKPFIVSVLISSLLCPAALTVAAFSKEKSDDERIDGIRWNALLKTVILYFILSILGTVVRFLLPPTGRIISLMAPLTSWTAFMVYYILIFKISLHNDNKALDNEE